MSGESDPYTGAGYKPDGDDSRHRLGRGVLVAVVSTILVGVLAGSVTIAYQLGFEAGASRVTPIITANGKPFKVRPVDPGGMKIPNQNKRIYEQLASAKGAPKDQVKERLVGSGERPIESLLMTVRPATVSPIAPPPRKRGSRTEGVLPPKVVLPPPPPPMKAPLRPPAGPIVIKDLTKLPKSAAKIVKPAKSTASPLVPKAYVPKVAASNVTAPKAVAPEATKSAPVVKSLPRVAALAPTPPASVRRVSGRYLVQLSSAKSREHARQSWVSLQRRHPDLFDDLSETIAKTYLGAKKGTWYRLRAGPFETRASAQLVCDRAKKRKVACFVARR